jgi:hypothetical protein
VEIVVRSPSERRLAHRQDEIVDPESAPIRSLSLEDVGNPYTPIFGCKLEAEESFFLRCRHG